MTLLRKLRDLLRRKKTRPTDAEQRLAALTIAQRVNRADDEGMASYELDRLGPIRAYEDEFFGKKR
jgi:hypothetical protein